MQLILTLMENFDKLYITEVVNGVKIILVIFYSDSFRIIHTLLKTIMVSISCHETAQTKWPKYIVHCFIRQFLHISPSIVSILRQVLINQQYLFEKPISRLSENIAYKKKTLSKIWKKTLILSHKMMIQGLGRIQIFMCHLKYHIHIGQ